MPSAAASAREILTRLHDVMASRTAGAGQAQLGRRDHRRGAAIARSARSTCCAKACSNCSRRAASRRRRCTSPSWRSARGWSARSPQDVETLNLDEAASHPDFAYKPETGEEKFHSFAGVPIIRRERAVGVLAVQHADPRRYDEVEIEALQTVAMVLSELIANAELVDDARRRRDRPAIDRGGAHRRA